MVYDSVGIGLGNFRFDRNLNEYVEDVNGDYKSYNILSGESISGSRIDGFSKFDYNFSKTEFEKLKPLKFRSIVRLDLHSKDANLFGDIDKQNTQFYNYSNKSEFIYQKNRSMSNYRIYYQKIRNFNGMDVRGWKEPAFTTKHQTLRYTCLFVRHTAAHKWRHFIYIAAIT